MLEYEWGNPSTIMLSGDDTNIPTSQDQENHNRHMNILDHYTNPNSAAHHSFNDNHHFIPQHQHTTSLFHHPPSHNPHQHHVSSLYDPRVSAAYTYATSTPHQPSFLSLDGTSAAAAPGYFLIPKSEDVSRPSDFTARIGLDLGGRTYFSSAEDDFVNRLYRRSRPVEPGSSNAPRCQAEGCNADLTHAKHYHRRHKVCEFHSKASTVIAAGLTQRFCQQCSRFHLLSEFDNGKRSCRKRLADHNRRRRKSHQNNQENHKSVPESAPNSSAENPTSEFRSPPDSGARSSSSVTVAISPPRMSLDCFKQRPYQATASSSSASSSSLFFSSG